MWELRGAGTFAYGLRQLRLLPRNESIGFGKANGEKAEERESQKI